MGQIDIVEIMSVFVVLLAIIDITGSIPIFLGLKQAGKPIKAVEASLASTAIFLVFFFAGTGILNLFSVDIETFAIAGSIVLMIVAFEMVLGVEIMKYDSNMESGASVVPIAFPLIAGPGALTTILTLRAEYAAINILIAMELNMIIAYVVLKYIDRLGKLLGNNVVFIIRKFFGVLLIAIAIDMFATNLFSVIKDLIE